MAKWETEIFRGDIEESVKNEYRKLLSVNINGEEAEDLLVKHFESHYRENAFAEARFWMALGLCEWQLGRLTQTAKKNAQKWAVLAGNDLSPAARQALVDTLDTPMPPPKVVRPPAYVSRCPWPVGSLLAYRIISSNHPHVTQSPFYGKYVLLRIIKIKRIPITKLAPCAGWDERMLVGLYNWIGDSIPRPGIIQNLEYTAISVQEPSIKESAFQGLQSLHLSAETDNQMQQLIAATTTQRIETCCDLDWRCLKRVNRNDVFTYLSCDSSFEREVLPFFKTNVTDYLMCNSIPFDAVLVNRFYQITEQTDK